MKKKSFQNLRFSRRKDSNITYKFNNKGSKSFVFRPVLQIRIRVFFKKLDPVLSKGTENSPEGWAGRGRIARLQLFLSPNIAAANTGPIWNE